MFTGILKGVSRVFALSLHAHYRCRHSGACCASDWDVPVDLPVYRRLDDALRAGRVMPPGTPHDDGDILVRDDAMPDDTAAIVARTQSGRCVFHHEPSGLCVVHRDLGEAALPVTCRHFPRLAVRDARGTFISLTHYCPTAAALLFEDTPITIVADPPAFPPGDYEGLVVDPDAWPPLLGPRLLMDLDAYGAWERHMVARCANDQVTAEDVVATLARDAALLQDFDPLSESLTARIDALPAEYRRVPTPESLDDSLDHFAAVMTAVPDDLRPAPDEARLDEAYVTWVRASWPAWHGPLRRYVAAKAFANWTAYQGRGLEAVVRGLEAALALVRVEAARRCRDGCRSLDADILREAVRAADFTLNHLAGGEELATGWSSASTGREVRR